ncbi:MAG: Rnase Y domain-containing protein, partial [Phycisphaerae bacterium]
MAPQLHLPLAVADPVVFTVSLLAAALVGAGVAWFLRSRQVHATRAAQQALADQELNTARVRAAEIVKQAEVESQKKLLETMERFERETQATREELRTAEKRLEKREDTLDKKLDVLSTKERKIESAEQRIA